MPHVLNAIYFLVFLDLLFVGCAPGEMANSQENQQPNVALIMCDDLNDYSGAFGGHPQAKTPNIDKLAESSVVFTNAHTRLEVVESRI